jgi:uncharacterized protein with FMN-binding domain
MHRGLVALSASAVAAIYMAGYLRTQSADASIAAAAVPTLTAAESAPVVAAAAPPTAPAPTIERESPRTQRSAPTPQPATPPRSAAPPTSSLQSGSSTQRQTQAGYKDGTFTGQGSSRRGDVWVSVKIQGGQIANVTITRSTLQYPLRDIANLPSQVVQRQSAQVDNVSRATYSSQAFRGAVSQALASAKA